MGGIIQLPTFMKIRGSEIMSISTEQFLAKQKDSIDNLVAAQTRLFSGFEQLVNLNMELFKASIDEVRSEEHTSELQSRFDIVCRLLLEKKNRNNQSNINNSNINTI